MSDIQSAHLREWRRIVRPFAKINLQQSPGCGRLFKGSSTKPADIHGMLLASCQAAILPLEDTPEIAGS